MDLSTITIADFKAYFRRDFPYLPTWDPAQLYNQGQVVYYAPTLLFYIGKSNGIAPGTLPTNATYWDVAVGYDANNYVLDADIQAAFDQATPNFNQTLYPDDATIQFGFLLLSAYYLVEDLQSAFIGAGAGGAGGPMSSRTVGNVSETYKISDAFINNPRFSLYSRNAYGLRWLSFIAPYLVGGGVGVVAGTSQP